MTRSRLLSVAVVVLVLLNLTTLGMLLFRKPPHPEHGKREGPKAVIIERLKFDPQQIASYEELIHDHFEKIRSLNDRMTVLRGRLYDAHDPLPADSLIQLIGATQEEIERTHTDHFARIKDLCKPDQLLLYDALTKDLAEFFRPALPPPQERR